MRAMMTDRIRETGFTDAWNECWEYGGLQTPEGGWHQLLIRRVGVYGVCRMFGGDPAVERHGWSEDMRAKFAAYDEGALQGAAEYLRAAADADAGLGDDWVDSKNPADPS